jgi:cell division protein FtsI/penicillin-binding protein 2
MRARPSQHQVLHKRIVSLTVFLLLVFGLVVARLFALQVISNRYYKALAEDQYTLVKKLTPERGEIEIVDKFSAEPQPVAANITKDLVYANPVSIKDPKAVADALAPILNLDPKDVLAKISDKTKQYVPLKKQLADDEEQKVKDLHLPGIAFDPEVIRFYPEATLLSQVLGYVGYKGNDKVGLYGLEKYFETDLKGTPGSLSQEKDATGAWIFGAKRDLQPAVNGDNLILTIDKNIQFKAESVLKDTVDKNGADSGSVIVMDPTTGAILAMANYPTFDPNDYNKTKDPALFSNNAVIGNYEPGSVFKPITMAAAVEEGKVSPDSTYNDTWQVVESDGKVIKNSDGKAHGVSTMVQVLDESLNTGAVYVKEQMGNAKFLDYLKKFGFGQKTGVELPETSGSLATLEKGNVKVNFDTAAFGQGITVTPLQLMEAYTALANGGVMMQPYIVQAHVKPDGKIVNTEPKKAGQVVSAQTASTISAMLVDVVENGHGKKAAVKGYYIGGKTGTAQVPRKDGQGYEPNNNIGTFIGYGPIEKPKFLMMVRVDHPRDVSFAESSAAPPFSQIAQFILNYYNIPPTRVVDAAKK